MTEWLRIAVGVVVLLFVASIGASIIVGLIRAIWDFLRHPSRTSLGTLLSLLVLIGLVYGLFLSPLLHPTPPVPVDPDTLQRQAAIAAAEGMGPTLAPVPAPVLPTATPEPADADTLQRRAMLAAGESGGAIDDTGQSCSYDLTVVARTAFIHLCDPDQTAPQPEEGAALQDMADHGIPVTAGQRANAAADDQRTQAVLDCYRDARPAGGGTVEQRASAYVGCLAQQ